VIAITKKSRRGYSVMIITFSGTVLLYCSIFPLKKRAKTLPKNPEVMWHDRFLGH